MEDKKPYLSCAYFRRFGTEIEINALDGLSKPVAEGALPDGIHYVGNLVQKTTGDRVVVHKWGHDHNNDKWVIKPDSSCGLEVCSPVSKGWHGLKRICQVVEAFAGDSKIVADSRCSLHVHMDVSDLSADQLAAVISWWIKCEPVFLDSVPPSRKKNRYCQFIGLWEMFEHDSVFSIEQLVKKLGSSKYGSLNTFHLKMGKRQTIEFRIMEGECCKNPYMVKNWVRLLVHFVERAYRTGVPLPFKDNDPWTGWCWLDPQEVFKLLGFDGEYDLSPGLRQVKSWFLSRLMKNIRCPGDTVLGERARQFAYDQCKYIALNSGLNIQPPVDMEQALYGDNFKV